MRIEGVEPPGLSSGDGAYSTTQAIGFALKELSNNVKGNLQQFLEVAIKGGGTAQDVYPPMQNLLASVVGNMDVLQPFLSAVFPNSSQISKDVIAVGLGVSSLGKSLQNSGVPLSSVMSEVNMLLANVGNLSDDVVAQTAKIPVSLSTYARAFESANTCAVSDLNILLHQPARDVDPYMASELLGITSIMTQLQICMPTPSIDYSNIASYLGSITEDLAGSPVNTVDIANEMAAIQRAIGS